MTDESLLRPRSRSPTPPILALPSELRFKVYSLVHRTPRIIIQDDYTPRLPLPYPEGTRRTAQLIPKSRGAEPQRPFRITYDDYDWMYMLTCRVFLEDLRPLIPPNVHLHVLSDRYHVHHIPQAVRARYLPYIPTLSIVGQYPVYDTAFDGSQLPGLKTLYLQDHQGSSKIEQQFKCAFPPPTDLIARIRGSYDAGYIERGLRKLQISKLNWWQADKTSWLHRVISAERPRNFRFIISQHVHIRFEDMTFPDPANARYISLVQCHLSNVTSLVG